jgi:two-component system, OmpR family, sensor histidine kinase KdpD
MGTQTAKRATIGASNRIEDEMLSRAARAFSRHGYMLALVAIAASTALFLPGRGTFAKGQWALLYLLVILLVASAAGIGPAILAAVLAFFAWNFFFLPPYHTFEIRDPKDWLSLVAFLVVGVLVGVQAGRMREREARALAREQETAALNRLSAAVVSQTSTEQMAESCLREVVAVLGAESATLFVLEDGDLRSYCQAPAGSCSDAAVTALARRAVDAEESTGGRADGSPAASAATGAAGDGGLYVPVRSPSGVSGVLTVQARGTERPYSPGDVRLVTSLSNLVGAFLEREKLQAAATTAAAEREGDRLKSSLLSSVSHELKTPLAALTATVSNLLESDVDWDEESVRDELRAIVDDVARLNNSISALLELSRLEAHAWEPRLELYELSDVVSAGIDTLPAHLRERVHLDLPEESPIVSVDFLQVTRALQSLLENALLYAGDATPVTVGARAWNEGVRLWVEDQGPGVPADEHEAVFEKFYRGRVAGERVISGTGLGLAITREIVRSHGGSILVEDAKPHGARFVIALPARPVDDDAPGKEGP